MVRRFLIPAVTIPVCGLRCSQHQCSGAESQQPQCQCLPEKGHLAGRGSLAVDRHCQHQSCQDIRQCHHRQCHYRRTCCRRCQLRDIGWHTSNQFHRNLASRRRQPRGVFGTLIFSALILKPLSQRHPANAERLSASDPKTLSECP